MIKLSKLLPLGKLNKARHRFGFGVHSPFGYAFINEVLRDRSHYYAFDVIRKKRQRILFKTICALEPRRIVVYDETLPEVVTWIARAADSRIAVTGPQAADDVCDGDMIVIGRNGRGLAAVGRAMCTMACGKMGKAVLTEWRAAVGGLDRGLTFDNGRDMRIVVRREGLPHQTIYVRY